MVNTLDEYCPNPLNYYRYSFYPLLKMEGRYLIGHAGKPEFNRVLTPNSQSFHPQIALFDIANSYSMSLPDFTSTGSLETC